MISIFDLAALLLTLSALFGWLNRRFLRMPHTIGLLVMGLLASLSLVGLDLAFPAQHLYADLTQVLGQVDFTEVVMNGMLAFLLFAGAMSLDLRMLRDRAWAVATLALVGTLISTALVGGAFWLAADAIGRPVPLAWAFVFGSLISPTDPVAVLATLKNVKVPEALEVEMQGEALFNDGIGIVLFTVLVAFAAGSGGEATSAGGVAKLLLQEAGGGLVLGVVTGYVAYRAMRAIDDFPVEVLITLALVAGTYALAQKLHFSGPLAVVAAGLLVGDRAPRDAMSEKTQGYVSALWTLIDEVLNSVLFLLIGLEVLVLRFELGGLALAACAVPIVLVARLVAVSTPLLLFRWGGNLSPRNVPFLTWAGVRGGISVA
ncbi:MAG: sodium:proton antiporter, partial [Methylobacterium sp.]